MNKKAKIYNAIIIDGETYELVYINTGDDDCGTCDLKKMCKANECICVDVFGYEKSVFKHFKKK